MLSNISKQIWIQKSNFFTTRLLSQGTRLIYDTWGDPLEVIKLEHVDNLNKKLESNEVHVEMIASPINPADINQIQGVYAVKPKLPAIGGNEGCGVIKSVGSNVIDVKPGDLVIPSISGFGTWRSEAIDTVDKVFKIDNRLSKEFASTIQVNPCTAYRMLEDFVKLQSKDVIVQNGANSAVGRYVIQIAKLRGIETINVVRDRKEIDELKQELKDLGATEVYTEEEFAKKVRGIKAKLALNNVSGRSSLMISRTLVDNGVMVTYGGMSKQPVQGPTGSFIFNDIIYRGFWMSRWYENAQKDDKLMEKRKGMYKEITDWILSDELKTPKMIERKPEDYKAALLDATTGSTGKNLFVF